MIEEGASASVAGARGDCGPGAAPPPATPVWSIGRRVCDRVSLPHVAAHQHSGTPTGIIPACGTVGIIQCGGRGTGGTVAVSGR